MRKTTIGTVLALAVMCAVISVFGSLVATSTFSNSGSISVYTPPPPPPPSDNVQVGLYSNSGCTTAVTSVSWGALNPGSTATRTIYVRNEGNVPATLSISTSSWSSVTAQSFLTLSWNSDGYNLAVGQIIQAVLSLTVSSSISGVTTFSFNTIITATQA